MSSTKITFRSIAMLGATGAAAVILSACGAGSAVEMANETPPVTPSSGTQLPPAPATTSTTIVPVPDYQPNETGPAEDGTETFAPTTTTLAPAPGS